MFTVQSRGCRTERNRADVECGSDLSLMLRSEDTNQPDLEDAGRQVGSEMISEHLEQQPLALSYVVCHHG